jgi:AcrR family transcriptional regulator
VNPQVRASCTLQENESVIPKNGLRSTFLRKDTSTIVPLSRQTPSLGLRETKKNERKQRIIGVAREMFREHGFEQSTTAEIARKARVGAGTLFRYVRDKNELLMLVIAEDLRLATASGMAAVNGRGTLTTRLVRLYRPRFEFWAANIGLTKSASTPILAGEAASKDSTFSRIGRSQGRLLAVITEMLSTYAEENGLALRKSAEVIARAVHYLYIGELRAWINETEPSIEVALANLQEHFDLLINGIFREPKPVQSRPQRPGPV